MAALRSRSGRELRRPRKVAASRWVAWQVIRRTFDEQAWTDRALAGEAARAELDPRDRAHAQRLTYGVVQQAKRLDHVIAACGKRPLRKIDAPVLQALRLGVYELVSGDGTGQHAAIDQAVEIVRGVIGERAVAFTNAVLRRAQVDAEDILATLDPQDDGDLATILSFPEWMVHRLRGDLGQRGIDALAAQNEPTSTTALRLNPLVDDPAATRAAMIEAGLEVVEVSEPFAALLPEACSIAGSTASLAPFVDRSVVHPQSLASMLVARVLDPQPGEHIVDLCAAPGGKAMHAAALMAGAGSILACELHDHRARSISFLATRSGCGGMVRVRPGDATTLTAEEAGGNVDRVLVDAPCSGLGVLAGRPDSRWRHGAEDVEDLVALQRALLETAARTVRPGGTVTYSTCTLLPAENEQVVRGVIDAGLLEPAALPDDMPNALRVDGSAFELRTWPHEHHTDGFYVARLRRPGESR